MSARSQHPSAARPHPPTSLVLIAVLAVLVGVACGGDRGACYGYSSILNKTYCYNDWSQSECANYNSQGVNGASWTLAPGEMCSDLGYTPSG